jgi:membrane protease YdiL (CAAX protease family)
LYANYLIPQLSFAVIALWFFRYRKIDSLEIKRQVCAPKYFIVAVLLQIGLFSLSELNSLFLTFLERFGYQDKGIQLPSMQGWGLVGVLLAMAVMPAVFEELFFRGVLLKGLRSFGTVGAVLLCGGLFSLFHQNPAQTIYQFCCGVAYALVALRSGSVLPTMLAHFLNNAVIILLTKFSVTLSPIIIVFSGVCLLGTICYLIFFDKKEIVKGEKVRGLSFLLCASVGILICVIPCFTLNLR